MSDHRSTFLGRDDVNDVESILADDAIDFGDLVHTQAVGGDAIFTWDYDRTRPALEKLYEKAKVRQWNANDLPWDTDVDVEAVALEMAGAVAHVRRAPHRGRRLPDEDVGRPRVDPVRDRGVQLPDEPVPPRRAGRARSAPRRSSRPCRGSTPSTTRPRR